VGNLIKQIWLVLLLALVFGTALAFTDQGTAQRIAENRRRQVRELSQRATLGELAYTPEGKPDFKIELEKLDLRDLTAYRVVPIDGPKTRTLGYAVIVDGIGWDRLRILVGFSGDLKQITGLEIVECRETPGLGARIKTDEFRNQYCKPTDKPLELVKHSPENDYQVQAITGATISSTAVTNMVNDAVEKACKMINNK